MNGNLQRSPLPLRLFVPLHRAGEPFLTGACGDDSAKPNRNADQEDLRERWD